MRYCLCTPWSAEYILPVTLFTSITPVSLYTHRHSVHLYYPCITVHLVALFNNLLGSCDRACLKMHLETAMEGTQRCTWGQGLSKFGVTHGDREIE
jgi:hypothetical protein